jgi:hypothetical protein
VVVNESSSFVMCGYNVLPSFLVIRNLLFSFQRFSVILARLPRQIPVNLETGHNRHPTENRGGRYVKPRASETHPTRSVRATPYPPRYVCVFTAGLAVCRV